MTTSLTVGQLLKYSDPEFDTAIQDMNVKNLLNTVTMLQKEMTMEQQNFDALSAELPTLRKSSGQYKQISQEMNASQTRLTLLMNRSMKCLNQQGNKQGKGAAPKLTGSKSSTDVVQRSNSSTELKDQQSVQSVQPRLKTSSSVTTLEADRRSLPPLSLSSVQSQLSELKPTAKAGANKQPVFSSIKMSSAEPKRPQSVGNPSQRTSLDVKSSEQTKIQTTTVRPVSEEVRPLKTVFSDAKKVFSSSNSTVQNGAGSRQTGAAVNTTQINVSTTKVSKPVASGTKDSKAERLSNGTAPINTAQSGSRNSPRENIRVESTSIPSVERNVPKDSKNIPNENKGAQKDSKSIQNEEKGVQKDSKSISTEVKSIPSVTMPVAGPVSVTPQKSEVSTNKTSVKVTNGLSDTSKSSAKTVSNGAEPVTVGPMAKQQGRGLSKSSDTVFVSAPKTQPEVVKGLQTKPRAAIVMTADKKAIDLDSFTDRKNMLSEIRQFRSELKPLAKKEEERKVSEAEAEPSSNKPQPARGNLLAEIQQSKKPSEINPKENRTAPASSEKVREMGPTMSARRASPVQVSKEKDVVPEQLQMFDNLLKDVDQEEIEVRSSEVTVTTEKITPAEPEREETPEEGSEDSRSDISEEEQTTFVTEFSFGQPMGSKPPETTKPKGRTVILIHFLCLVAFVVSVELLDMQTG